MIESTLENIRKYLELKFEEAGKGAWKVYLGAIDKNDAMESGLYITLLRIEEETSIKQQSGFHRVTEEEGYYANPDIYVNLYIVISAHAENYNTGLMQISSTISLLNSRHDFAEKATRSDEETKNSQEKNKIHESVKSLALELQSLNAEQNNSMWQTLGSKVVPAVCYKVRMITISDEMNRMSAPLIKNIENNILL